MRLSKSRYTAGVQCPKTCWMREHMPERFDESVLPQAILAQGNVVGDLAMGYFGDYVEVPFNTDFSVMIDDTLALVEAGEPVICEASFSYEGNFCSVDILKVDGDGWHIYEVKSSTHAKPVYVEDVSYQWWVLRRLGYPVVSANLMLVDNTYERDGDIELDRLFRVEDHTFDAMDREELVGRRVAQFKGIAELEDEPVMILDKHCERPYECPFKGWCWRDMPKPSIWDLKGVRERDAAKYMERGILSLRELRDSDIEFRGFRAAQLACVDTDEPLINAPKLREFLQGFTYPLAFLDFETAAPAVPLFDGMRPYQNVTFQYSLHLQMSEDAPIVHYEFLGDGFEDPSRALAESLIRDIPCECTLIAYNASFEQGRIKELANRFLDIGDELLARLDHVVDLIVPFKNAWYYQRSMGGSSSIKKVLPALYPDDPELAYDSLSGVHKGDEASGAYIELPTLDEERREIVRRELLDYCKLDTLAMVKVYERLKEVAGVSE